MMQFHRSGLRRALALFLAVMLLTVVLAGCPKDEEAQEPANLGVVHGRDSAPAQSGTSSSGSGSGTSSAETDAAEGSGGSAEPGDPEDGETGGTPPEEEPAVPAMRPLTDGELNELEDLLTNFEANGFLVCSYSRPEEIDWDEVFYNGAGIAIETTPELREEYESWEGEIMGDLTAVRYDDVVRFVQEKTGTEYRAARNPLDWYYSDTYGVYLFEHGDTNYQQISFTAGETDGTTYRLYYRMSDWMAYRWDCSYVLTGQVRDSRWYYVSNLPAEDTPPVTLLNMEFHEMQEEIAGLEPAHYTEIRRLDSDEDSTWYWVVVTAQEDGVRVSLDRDYAYGELEEMYYYAFQTPDENLDSFVLNRGEQAVFRVNMPWYPRIRLAAFWGTYFGEYWFGEDNWLHLWDDYGVPLEHWITGHDYDGENRGCSYRDETGLAAFLSAGPWIYYRNEADGAAAVVSFEDYRAMWVVNDFETYHIFLTYGQDGSASGEAPNILRMEKYDNTELTWETVPLDGDVLGAYRIEAVQMDGEQILTLTETEGGAGGSGVLSYLFPDYDETVHSFTLHRYIGAAPQQ